MRFVQPRHGFACVTIRRIGMTFLADRTVRGVGFEDNWDNPLAQTIDGSLLNLEFFRAVVMECWDQKECPGV